jgi:hypothetical protein
LRYEGRHAGLPQTSAVIASEAKQSQIPSYHTNDEIAASLCSSQ